MLTLPRNLSHVLLFLPSLVEIEVDISRPENNREFYVYDVGQQLPGVGKEYEGTLLHGYWVLFPMDPRWAMDDKHTVFYSATCKSTTEIEVKVPALDYDLRHNREAFACLPTIVPEYDVQAIDDFHWDLSKASDTVLQNRKWRTYRLIFPRDVKLSSSAIYDKAGKEENLKDTYLSVSMTHGLGRRFFVAWHVARTDLKPRAAGEVVEDEDGVSALAKALADMGYADTVKHTLNNPLRRGGGGGDGGGDASMPDGNTSMGI